MIRAAGIVAAFVVAIGVAFYAGKVYQNNSDQALFATYNPPTATGRGGGAGTTSFFGGAASGGSQVAAALAVGTPPAGGPALGSTGGITSTTRPAGGGSASVAPAATPAVGTTGSTSTGSSSGAAAGATATDVAGTLQSMDGQSVTLKTTAGVAQSVTVGSSTTYYVATVAPASALKMGQNVTVSMQIDASGTRNAGSITIAPAGVLYGYVRAPVASVTGGAATGSGAAGSGGGFSASGGSGSSGGLGAGGFGGGFATAGAITALSGNSITITSSTGRAIPLPITSSTPVYELEPVAASKLGPNATISVHASTVAGKLVAQNVVASNIPNMIASLTTPPARRSFGGAGGAGGSGGAGSSSGFTNSPGG